MLFTCVVERAMSWNIYASLADIIRLLKRHDTRTNGSDSQWPARRRDGTTYKEIVAIIILRLVDDFVTTSQYVNTTQTLIMMCNKNYKILY